MMEYSGNRAESEGFTPACQVDDNAFSLSHTRRIFREYTQITAICNLFNNKIIRTGQKIGAKPILNHRPTAATDCVNHTSATKPSMQPLCKPAEPKIKLKLKQCKRFVFWALRPSNPVTLANSKVFIKIDQPQHQTLRFVPHKRVFIRQYSICNRCRKES